LDRKVGAGATAPIGRILAEIVIIVASILLAFGIDALWEERKNFIEEQEILQGLREEFALNRDILEEDMVGHAENVRLLLQALKAIEEGSLNDFGVVIDDALKMMLAPNTTDMGNGALNALLSSGRIELLANKELRARLAAWNGVFAEVQDDQQNNGRMVFDHVIPFMMRNGVPAGAPLSRWHDDWPVAERSISADPEALADLMESAEFRVLLEVRFGYKMHLTGEYQKAMIAVAGIIEEIESSIH